MSRGSRGASDVLAQIRSVITHLEKKDRKLNDELQSLRLIGSGSESDQIKNAQAEITRLSSQKSKLTADLEESKTSYTRIRQKNEILHRELDNERKDSKQHQNNSEHNLKYGEHYKTISENLQSEILKIQGENNTLKNKNEGLQKDLDSYDMTLKNLRNKKEDLENENAALKQNISQLTSKPASSDQARLQKDNVLLAQQLNDAKAEVKRYFDLSEQNRNNAKIYKELLNQTEKENEILKEQNANLMRGTAASVQSGSGALADSPGLASLDPPPRVSTRVDVEHTKDPTVSAHTDISQKKDESQHAAQEGGGIGSLLGSTVRGIKNTVSYFTGVGGGVDSTATAEGRGGQDSRSADSESDDRSDDGDETAASSPKVSHPYAVTAVVKEAPAAAANSNNTVGGQPTAGKAQEDYSNILDLTADKNTINTLYNKLKILPHIPIDNNKTTSAATMVNRILNSPQYQSQLKTTAKKYNIDISLDDSKKIDLLYKYFGEYKRAFEISNTDYTTACSKLRKLEKADEDNFSKQQMLSMFHQIDSQERSQLSYCLFAVLGKENLEKFAKSLGVSTTSLKKREIIDKLIEIPSTNWTEVSSEDIDSITNK